MHNHLPSKIQVNFKAYEDQDRAPSQLTDFHFSDKCRGFLLLESGGFDFIVIDCIVLDNIIRETGKPSYQQSRIPLNFWLNIHK